MSRITIAVLISALSLVACSSDEPNTEESNNQVEEFDCVPDESTWQAEIRPIVETHCVDTLARPSSI